MSDGHRSLLGSGLLSAETSREGDRVTTLELFSDLIYVFAFTQVIRLMAEHHDPTSVLQGIVVLALVWWSWISYTWLGNQAHADRGIVRVGVIAAIVLMFPVALTIGESFSDLEGGLYAPLVFVISFVAVRLVHPIVYFIAARGDAGLRRQIVVSIASSVAPSSVLLVIGALVGQPYQVWIWLAAITLELTVIYVTGLGGNWRLNSVAHFAERHGLIVILALGESIIAIGVGAARLPVDGPIIIGSVLGVALAIGMWWAYFHRLAPNTEREVARLVGGDRARVAIDVYTYMHLALVAGVVLTALGVELAMEHLGEVRHELGRFSAFVLGGGVSVYLAGTTMVWWRVSREWSLVRLGGATLALVLIPVLALVHSLTALATVVVVVVGVVASEQILGSRAKVGRPEARDNQSTHEEAGDGKP